MISGLTAHAFRRVLTALAVTLPLAAAPLPASAQEQIGESPGSYIGPLTVKPTINWRTEHNDNVFRSAQPISDIVSTIGGSTDVRGQVRRIALTATGAADWVHYSKLESERGANVSTGVRIGLLSTRVAPYATASYGNSRSRVHQEIDTRPRIEQVTAGAGGIVRFGPKTSLDLSARRTRVAFGRQYSTEDGPLDRALNRATDQVSLSLRRELTPLTWLTLTGERDQASFHTSSFRNAEETRATAGFESDGRLKGHARAGLRFIKLTHVTPIESRGVFVSAGTSMTVLDRLQIGIDVHRDVEPSYRTGVAYYEAYGYGTSITYAIRRSIRLSAMSGRRFNDYRDPDLTGLAAAERAGTDIETRYGSGLGFRIGERMSIDFTGLHTSRRSFLDARRFENLSLVAGVSHAF